MSVIYLLLPVAVVLAIAALIAFTWAVRDGQLDDLETPALRILHDDEHPPSDPHQRGLSAENSRKARKLG